MGGWIKSTFICSYFINGSNEAISRKRIKRDCFVTAGYPLGHCVPRNDRYLLIGIQVIVIRTGTPTTPIASRGVSIMILAMTHGHFCLIGRLLSLKRWIDLNRLITTVKFTHMAFQTKALIWGTALFLFANHSSSQAD